MTREELIKSFHQRDRLRSVLSINGHFRASLVKNSVTARAAQESHGLDTVSAYLLSKYLTAASLISSTLKGQERVVVEAEGNGPVSRIYAEASHIGEVRGFIDLSQEKSLSDINHFDEAIGIGLLRVSRILYNEPEPVTGIVPIATGDIAKDLAFYYVQSEQVPTALFIDTEMGEDGFVATSGGLLVQAMPGASEIEMEAIQSSLEALGGITQYLRGGGKPIDILQDILPFSFSETKTSPIDFFCRCSKERFMDRLLTLAPHELRGMQEEGQNELICQFCGSKYYLGPDDFAHLITAATAKSN